MTLALPPGINETEFANILTEFAAVVGEDWVLSSDEDVLQYRDSYSIFWGEEQEILASAAVVPDTVEQVQQIVRIANRYRLPLYPISTGRNLTYGGSAPTLSGSVVVDLKRMNRILEVNEDRHFILVEPGVSYFELYEYIKERGLNILIDIPDPGWGSPVGNSLDHGVGYTLGHYRDHFGSHCGMEVVTPDGELMRTGMGAIPGAETWQDFHYGAGATVDGLFAQSNFGIVTKMGFWFMPMPEAHLMGTVTVPEYQDLIPLIKEVNYLEDSMLIGHTRFSSPVAGGFGGSPQLRELMSNGWPSMSQLEDYVRRQDAPAWSVSLQFYGPEETIRGTWSAVQRRIGAAITGATFTEGRFVNLPIPPDLEADIAGKTSFGIPALEIFRITTRNQANNDDPIDGHADFFAMLPRTAQANWDCSRVIAECFQESGMAAPTSPFTTPSIFYPRCYTRVVSVPTWRDPVKNQRSRELYSRIIDRCAENGWGAYRTSPAFQDQVVGVYSFNNHALLRFKEKLKDSIDPNGIISPGRYGVWPANMRNNQA